MKIHNVAIGLIVPFLLSGCMASTPIGQKIQGVMDPNIKNLGADVTLEIKSCEIGVDRTATCKLRFDNKYRDRVISGAGWLRLQDNNGEVYTALKRGFGNPAGQLNKSVTAVADQSYEYTAIATNLSSRSTSISAVIIDRIDVRPLPSGRTTMHQDIIFSKPPMAQPGQLSTEIASTADPTDSGQVSATTTRHTKELNNDVSLEIQHCQIKSDRTALCKIEVDNKYRDRSVALAGYVRFQANDGVEYSALNRGFGDPTGQLNRNVTAVADHSYQLTAIASNLSTKANAINAVIFDRVDVKPLPSGRTEVHQNIIFSNPKMLPPEPQAVSASEIEGAPQTYSVQQPAVSVAPVKSRLSAAPAEKTANELTTQPSIIVGCWQWSNNTVVQFNQDGTARTGHLTGTWSQTSKNSVEIHWQKFIDNINLVADGSMTSGVNNYGMPLSSKRTSGDAASLVGTWKQGNDLVEFKPDGTALFNALPLGKWSNGTQANFQINWQHYILDKVTLLLDNNNLSIQNVIRFPKNNMNFPTQIPFGQLTAQRKTSCN